MSYLNLQDYDNQLANVAQQFSTATEKDSLLNNIHDRANKAIELGGEAKAFLSAKPVGKYLVKKTGAVLDDAVKNVGVKFNEVRSQFQDAQKIGAGLKNIVNSEGVAGSRVVASSTLGNLETGVGAKAVAQNGLVKPAIQSIGNVFKSNTAVESEETGERAELVSSQVSNLNARAGSLLDRLNSATQGGGAAQQPGILAPEANASIQAGATEKANQQFDKTDAGEEEEEEEQDVGKTGKKVAEEEEEDADITGDADADAPELAPVASIIGLVVGAGLALKAVIDKPKQLSPVDNINASYQIGI